MNRLILSAGLLALFTTFVHFFLGHYAPLMPMLNASFDETSKLVMHVVWHCVSFTLAMDAMLLLFIAFRPKRLQGSRLLTRFIAIQYAAFGFLFITLGLIKMGFHGLTEMPQWTLLLPVAAMAWIGSRKLEQS